MSPVAASDVLLAYLAGIVDGEAYVGIKKGRRPDSINPLYHERIQVRMVDIGAVELLVETFGGHLYHEKLVSETRRPLYCWAVSDASAARVLAQLLPFLRVKREQALNVLELRRSKEDPRARRRGNPSHRPMPSDIVDAREVLYLRARELNGRG